MLADAWTRSVWHVAYAAQEWAAFGAADSADKAEGRIHCIVFHPRHSLVCPSFASSEPMVAELRTAKHAADLATPAGWQNC